MTVLVDGETRYSWPVSTGMKGYATPAGTFRPFRLEEEHYSKEWDDAPMPFSIFFTQKGHAIHGYLDTKNIGRPASHGCVRLTKANAEKLYALVQEDGVLNTTVILTGTTPSRAPAVAKRQPPHSDELDEEYVQQQQQPAYGPRYGSNQPAYGNPYYAQPQYGQPYYQQQYAQPQYAQPSYQQQYAPPQYAQPPRYYYRDPYPYQRY